MTTNVTGPSPAQRYAGEYRSACAWSAAHALRTPPAAPSSTDDCVDWDRAGPVLEQVLAAYSDHAIAAQAPQINQVLLPALSAACGVPFTLTLGWIETCDDRYCQHGPELPAKLLQEGLIQVNPGALPMHVWLTSPACEIIDVTLPVRLSLRSGGPDEPRPVFYFSSDDTEERVIYHPTVVGDDFLSRIGLTFHHAPLSGRQ